MSFKLKELQKCRSDIQKNLDSIDELIKRKKSKTLVQCTSNFQHGQGCGKKTQIGKLTYIQTHWYESPWGCTGGACWHQGDGEFDCPKCGHRNRLYDRKEIKKLKHLFKDVIEEHKH